MLRRMLQNPIHCFGQRADPDIRHCRWGLLGVTPINPYGLASGIRSGFNIAPTITGHKTLVYIDTMLPRGSEYQTGARLAAVTGILIVVEAGEDVIQQQLMAQSPIHFLNNFTLLPPPGNFRLI